MGNKNVITKDDCYLFGKGTHYEIYEKLGAHVTTIDGVKGITKIDLSVVDADGNVLAETAGDSEV